MLSAELEGQALLPFPGIVVRVTVGLAGQSGPILISPAPALFPFLDVALCASSTATLCWPEEGDGEGGGGGGGPTKPALGLWDVILNLQVVYCYSVHVVLLYPHSPTGHVGLVPRGGRYWSPSVSVYTTHLQRCKPYTHAARFAFVPVIVSKQAWCLTSTEAIRLIRDGEKGE